LIEQGEISNDKKGIVFSDTLISKNRFVLFKFGVKELHATRYLYILNSSGSRVYIEEYGCESVMKTILSDPNFIELSEAEKLEVLTRTISFLSERSEKASQLE
jgi:hypothetical protein